MVSRSEAVRVERTSKVPTARSEAHIKNVADECLSATRLAKDLIFFSKQGLNGTLDVLQPESGEVITLYIHRGMPVFAEGGSFDSSLGNVLIRQGRITRTQHAEVMRILVSSLFESEEQRFGEVAIRLGFLTPIDLHHALADQVKRRIVDVLVRDHVKYEFREDVELCGVPHYPLHPVNAIAEAYRKVDSLSRLRSIYGAFEGQEVELSVEPNLIVEQLGLSGKGQRFLRSLANQSKPFSSLVKANDLGTAQFLAILTLTGFLQRRPHQSGLIAIDGKARPTKRPSLNPKTTKKKKSIANLSVPTPDPARVISDAAPVNAEAVGFLLSEYLRVMGRRSDRCVLGLGRHIRKAEVEAAFGTATSRVREAHADVSEDSEAHRWALQLLTRLEVAKKRLLEVAEEELPPPTPSSNRVPERITMLPPPTTAEDTKARVAQFVQRGRFRLAVNRSEQALSDFRRAHDLAPDSAEIELHMLWAKCFMMPEDSANELHLEHIRVVRQQALKFLKLNRSYAFAHYVLGRCALWTNDVVLAHRALRAAHLLDREDIEFERFYRHARVCSERQSRPDEKEQAAKID